MAIARLSEVGLEYFEHGHGAETVVLVHGFQASARIWHAVQRALPAERYRSIAVNNRGAGASDAPPGEADFTIGKFASDLHELVVHLGLRDFTLVGHSMGGVTAMQFAVDHPALPKALVLLDPAGPDGPEMSDEQLERFLDDRSAARREVLARGAAAGGLDAEEGVFPPVQMRLLLADIAAAPERRLRGSMRSMLRTRIGDRVRQLPLPALLAAGDRDALVPLAGMLDTWRKLPPGSGLHVWHGVGHSPNVDRPAEVAALLQRFVEVTVPAMSGRTRTGAGA
jgi:branched-chain amino acid transport system permease protein